MKIAVIIERMDISLGGAERSVMELVQQLGALGTEVHLLAARGRASAPNIHILCSDLPTDRPALRYFDRALQKHLTHNHYDIIHSTLPLDFADFYQPRGGSYLAAMKYNTLSYPHQWLRLYKEITHPFNRRRLDYIRAEKQLCTRQNGPHVLALSEFTAGHFREYYSLPENRLTVLPNAVKTDRPFDESKSRVIHSRILDTLGLREPDSPVLVLFAAHNFRLKGLIPLMKALSLIRDEPGPKICLVVAGRKKPLFYKLLAKKLGIAGRVCFFGSVPGIRNLLAACEIAALPTFYDPSSRFILEALAAGLPVITTRNNGAAERYEHRRHGWILERPDDSESLAEALRHFREPDARARARAFILEDSLPDKVSIKHHAARLLELYNIYLQSKETPQ